MTVDGDDGGFAATLDGDLPADVPFPLPDEFEVGSSMEIQDEAGITYSAAINVSAEEYDAVKAMYEPWLEAEGFTLDAFEMDSGDGAKAVALLQSPAVMAYSSSVPTPVEALRHWKHAKEVRH